MELGHNRKENVVKVAEIWLNLDKNETVMEKNGHNLNKLWLDLYKIWRVNFPKQTFHWFEKWTVQKWNVKSITKIIINSYTKGKKEYDPG